MRTWDKLEHSNLPEGDVPAANIRQKKLYCQMTIMMNGGPIGKGIRIQHPKCVIAGIHMSSPDRDGNYMGHAND
jgi:hypothetical protein